MNAWGTEILLHVPPVDKSRTARTEPAQTAREARKARNEPLFMKIPLYSMPFDEGTSVDAFLFMAHAADRARAKALNTASSE